MKTVKAISLTLFLFICGNIVFAQSDSTKEKNAASSEEHPVEVMPTYPGGDQALFQFIFDNLRTPESVRNNGVGGEVVIFFVVDTLGNATDIKVTKSFCEDFDNEAMRVIGLVKGFTPATQNGRKVKVGLNIPIRYNPTKASNKRSKKKQKEED